MSQCDVGSGSDRASQDSRLRSQKGGVEFINFPFGSFGSEICSEQLSWTTRKFTCCTSIMWMPLGLFRVSCSVSCLLFPCCFLFPISCFLFRGEPACVSARDDAERESA